MWRQRFFFFLIWHFYEMYFLGLNYTIIYIYLYRSVPFTPENSSLLYRRCLVIFLWHCRSIRNLSYYRFKQWTLSYFENVFFFICLFLLLHTFLLSIYSRVFLFFSHNDMHTLIVLINWMKSMLIKYTTYNIPKPKSST